MQNGSGKSRRSAIAWCLKMACAILLALLLVRATFGPVRGLISARSTLNVAAFACLCMPALMLAMLPANTASTTRVEKGMRRQIALVFGLAFMPYLFVLRAPFVFDDYVHLFNSASSLALTLRRAFFEHPVGGDGFFRPFGTLYFWLALRLAGLSSAWWHIFSITLHALNSGLVLLLLRRFINSAGACFAAALLFAWHGSHVEAVVWMAASFDLLSTFFTLLTLGVVTSSWPAGPRYASALLAAMAACLCKESALCLPLLVFCLAAVERGERRDRISRAGIVVAVGCATEFLLRLWYLRGIGGYQTSSGSPMVFMVHPLGVAQTLGLRLWALLSLPVNWSAPIESWLTIMVDSALVLGAISVLKLRQTRYAPLSRMPAFLMFTLCAALPVVPILMVGPDLNGARVLYLPSVGFCFLAAEAASVLSSRPAWPLFAASAVQLVALLHNERIWVTQTQAASRVCRQAAVLLKDHPAAELFAPDLPKTQRGVYFLGNGFAQCVAASGSGVSPLRVHNAAPSGAGLAEDYVGLWDAEKGQLNFTPASGKP